MKKIKLAFFSFASCEGCQLSFLELEDELPDILKNVEIACFREASSVKMDRYDVAFIEGSIVQKRDIAVLKEIRRKAKCLVSFGACATSGGVNYMRNRFSDSQAYDIVYRGNQMVPDLIKVHPVHKLVNVDYFMYGCPVSRSEFIRVYSMIMLGKKQGINNTPVCVECKLRENLCLLISGKPCLGPVTMCGCEAICTSSGFECEGCRGLVESPNLSGLREGFVLRGIDNSVLDEKIKIFNSSFEELSNG